jgi:hypothetical protein
MKLYVVVPRTLSTPQKAVQGGHAIADFMIRNPESQWRGHSLIFLTVPTEQDLKDLLDGAQGWCRCEVGWFCEPYWNNKLTSVAIFGDDAGERLKSLPLMKA